MSTDGQQMIGGGVLLIHAAVTRTKSEQHVAVDGFINAYPTFVWSQGLRLQVPRAILDCQVHLGTKCLPAIVCCRAGTLRYLGFVCSGVWGRW